MKKYRGLEEHRKMAKLSSEDYIDSMYDSLSDYQLWNTNYSRWEEKNKSHFNTRSFGVDEYKNMSIYPNEKKYFDDSLSDLDRLNTKLTWDGFSKYLLEDRSRIGTEESKKDNPNITREKDRIKKQRDRKEAKRKDKFAIGTVYLNIPPTQISVSDEKHNFRFSHLRSSGETILNTGKSTIRIDLDIFFNGLDDINNKFRPLLAQFKTTPFLPIDNEYIRNILDPFKDRMDESEEDSKKTIDKLLELEGKKEIEEVKMRSLIKYITNQSYSAPFELELNDIVNAEKSLLGDRFKEFKDKESWIEDNSGNKKIDRVRLISRYFKIQNSKDLNLVDLYKKINQLDDTQKKIMGIEKKYSELDRKCIEERVADKQIVGVLSQISVSTVPGYTESLTCRISLFVFNYEPFMRNFEFINGTENKSTEDITKCDLFVVWYTKRFLSGDLDHANFGLGEMIGNGNTLIRYIKNPKYLINNSQDRDALETSEIIMDGNGISVTGVTVSFRNVIQFLPVLSHQTPTCQYLGAYSTEIQLNIQVTDNKKLLQLNRMVEKYRDTPRTGNKYKKYDFMYIENELLQLSGMKYFSINSYNVDTVPGNPGLFSVAITLSEHKLDTEKTQTLRRIGITDDDEIRFAIKIALDSAHLYASSRSGNEQYELYYNLLFGKSGYLYDNNHRKDYNNVLKLYKRLPLTAASPMQTNPSKGEYEIHSRIKYSLNSKYPAPTSVFYLKKQENLESYSKDMWNSVHESNESAYNEFSGIMIDYLFLNNKEDFKAMLLEPGGNIVREKVEQRRYDRKKSRSYCYPDLVLPKYIDIPPTLELRDKYADIGKAARVLYSGDEFVQHKYADVDPDFFMYKDSLLKNADIKDNTMDLVNQDLSNFVNLLFHNKEWKGKSPSEEDIEGILRENSNKYSVGNKNPVNLDPGDVLKSNETYWKPSIITKKTEELITGWVRKAGDVLDESSTAQVSRGLLGGAAGMVINFITGAAFRKGREIGEAQKKKEKYEDNIAVGGEQDKDYTQDEKELRNKSDVTNDIGQDKGKGHFTSFDRESVAHVGLLTKKIKESIKDDYFSLSRAFPTFKLYIIEEDRPEMNELNDKYEYMAVKSIDIVKSRKEAADTAVITVVNTLGKLDKSAQRFDEEGNQIKPIKESRKREDQETKKEQKLEDFQIKPGTRIQIRMGYSSDPEVLDIVFNGMVSESNIGDIITIVAQGYGVELLYEPKKTIESVRGKAAFKLLDKLISSPEILHFGKWKWLPELDKSIKLVGRRLENVSRNPRSWEYKQPNMWRGLPGIRHLYELRNNVSDDNIYAPDQSWLYNIFSGAKQSFIMKNKTIWDIFQDMSRRMPGYIATVLPFDERATMFFGPADWTYNYTNRDIMERENRRLWDTMETDSIIAHLENVEGKISKAKDLDRNNSIGLVNKQLNKMWNKSNLAEREKYRKDIEKLGVASSSVVDHALSGVGRNKDNVSRYLKSNRVDAYKVASTSLGSEIKDQATKRAWDMFLEVLKEPTNYDIKLTTDRGGNKVSLELDKDSRQFYVDKDNKIYPESYYINKFNAYRDEYLNDNYPGRKLVRQYHLKDSIHHIVANNIIASDRYMSNKITVEYASEKEWMDKDVREKDPVTGKYETKKVIKKTPQKLHYVSCQADDDIWPEKIREKVVLEQNARDIVTAWNYGIGNLWLSMRDMYVGELTILGDASIKPHDCVFIADYFTGMYGPIEVEQVVHHFSQESGFVTTITPDLVCYANNIISIGENLLVGGYMDSISQFITNSRLWSLTVSGSSPIEKLIFTLGGMSTGRREPISFTPLIYDGRPYYAGLEGFRKDTFMQSIHGNIDRWYDKTKEALIAASADITFVADKISRRAAEER